MDGVRESVACASELEADSKAPNDGERMVNGQCAAQNGVNISTRSNATTLQITLFVIHAPSIHIA